MATYTYIIRDKAIHAINTSNGGRLNSFRPLDGGEPIYVDYNPNLNRLVVTMSEGVILVTSTSGGRFTRFYANDAVMARWDGDKIIVQFRNGKLTRYTQNGASCGSL